MAITPIETQYAGHRFRSRLEARWAVFFDHLDIKWEYEPQGYAIGPDERPYLPDFRLREYDIWVEVKGSEEHLDVELIMTAAIPHFGLPGGFKPDGDHQVNLLILGPIDQAGPVADTKTDWTGYSQPLHTALAFRKGDVFQWLAYFTGDGGLRFEPSSSRIGNDGPTVHWDGRGTRWGNLVGSGAMIGETSDERVYAAYTAARSARFEHRQSGAPSSWTK